MSWNWQASLAVHGTEPANNLVNIRKTYASHSLIHSLKRGLCLFMKYLYLPFGPGSFYPLMVTARVQKGQLDLWNLILFSGVFNPVTPEGSMIVDGIHVSCYGSYDHKVAHWACSPLRWLPGWITWGHEELTGTLPFINFIKYLAKSMPFGLFKRY